MVRVKEPTGKEVQAAFVAGAKMRTVAPLNSVGWCIPPGRAGDQAYCVFSRHVQSGSIDMVLFLLFLGEMVGRP